MKLYNYFRSSASYRVRIALNLKGRAYEYIAVPILENAQRKPDYLDRNPQGLIPALEVDGQILSQSLAIIDYLDRRWPKPPLYPDEPCLRAKALSFALHVAAEISPLNNTRVLHHLSTLGIADATVKENWYRHWIAVGFQALEAMLEGQSGPYCFGAQPTIADIYLVPQLFNARRFNCDLASFPKLVRFGDHARATEAFARAAPELQPDAV